MTWTPGDLEPGEIRTLFFETSARDAAFGGALQRFAGLVTAPGFAEQTPSYQYGFKSGPVLTVGLDAEKAPVPSGGTYTYRITTGVLDFSSGADDATLRLELPGEVTFISATGNPTAADGVVTWSFGPLGADFSDEQTVIVQADAALNNGQLLKAGVTFDPGTFGESIMRGSLVTPIAPESPLKIALTTNDTPANSDTRVDYELTVSNDTQFPITDTEVQLVLGGFLSRFRPGSTSDPSNVSNCGSSCSAGEIMVWSAGTLTPGEAKTLYFETSVSGPGGDISRFRGLANTSRGAEQIFTPNIAIDASAMMALGLSGAPRPVSSNGTYTYRLNYGAYESRGGASDATMCLLLPDGVTPTSTNGGTISGNVVEWSLGAVGADNGGRRIVEVNVDEMLPEGSLLQARASLSSGNVGETTQRASLPLTTLTSNPLRLTVTPPDEPVQPGQQVTYNFEVENTGSANIASPTAKIVLPDFLSSFYPSSTSDPGNVSNCGSFCEAGEVLIWTPPDLTPGQSRTLSFTTSVFSSATRGDLLRMRLEASGAGASTIYQTINTGIATDFDAPEPEDILPFIAVTPESIDFDGVEPGTSATETFTIENTGDASLDGEVSLSDDGSVFSLSSGSGAFALAPGESQAVEVTFTPEAVGTFTGTVAVSHNADNASSPVQIGLTGLATVSPVVAVTPEDVDFGSAVVGTSQTEALTIANTGGGLLEGTVSLSQEGGAFALTAGEGNFSLESGETQEVEVAFTPGTTSNFTGTVAVSHNASNEANPVEVALSGSGIAPAIAVAPEAIGFGSVLVGASGTEGLTIENTGSAPLEGTVSLSGDTSAFTITDGNGDFSIAPGETQAVEVTFAPGESASFAGTVAIEHNASNASSPVEVSLTGNGIAPAIAVTPEAVNFGSVVTGESATETLTIENTGDASLDGEVSLSNGEGVFTLASGSGTFALPPGDTQAVEVTFTPGESASFTGNVAVEHNASNASSPVDVTLTGNGTAPAIAVDSEVVDFGSVIAGDSALQSLAIENTGTAPLEGTVSLSGNASAFTLTEGSGDFSIAPSETQAVEVTFAPEEAASFAGTIAISHNASNATNPVEVALTGEATPARPVITQELADAELAVGAAASTRDLTQYIEPPPTSPGPLTFSASSSSPIVAAATVDGSTLRVLPNSVGMATIEVTAETEAGAAATLEFLADVNALAVTATRSFGDPRSASSYRLVGLPGQIDEDVAATLAGEAGTAWRVFRETGTTTGDADDYLVAYDGSEAFRFAPGRGFWMLSRADWAVDTTIGAVELTGDSTTTVPLQEGWNILSNPLDQPVNWNATLGLPANDGLTETLWQWDGSWSEASRLESARDGDAYYLFNNGGLDALTLQHPTAADGNEAPAIAAMLEDAETLRLTATLNVAPGPSSTGLAAVRLGTVTIGRASDGYATRQPPGHFMPATFYVEAPDESGVDNSEPVRTVALSRLLNADVLKTDGPQGMAFDLRLEATPGSRVAPVATGATAHITLHEVLADDQFAGEEVLLIAPGGTRHNLRSMDAGAPIEVALTDASAELRVLIGTEAFIDEELQVPESLTFGPVYPNPSRGPVTIEVGMPEAADAEIALYDMLGRRVATLHDGELPRGLSEVQWTGDRLASGMYFLRLRSEGQTFTEKVVRVR